MKSIYKKESGRILSWVPYRWPRSFQEYVEREWYYLLLPKFLLQKNRFSIEMWKSCLRSIKRKGFYKKTWRRDYIQEDIMYKRNQTVRFKIAKYLYGLSYSISKLGEKIQPKL